jgi:hypothetical protein
VDGPCYHPKMINAKHVDFFESQEKVPARDLHGPGEMLFARKFSDDDLHLIERITAMNTRKGKLAANLRMINPNDQKICQ